LVPSSKRTHLFGFGETGKIFGLLVLFAALTAIAQQTLP